MSSEDETGLYALPLEASAPMRELKVGYPDDYRDPDWDGSEQQYREIVMPARLGALQRSFDAALADLGFPEMHWEWRGRDDERPAPIRLRDDIPDDELARLWDVLERAGQAWGHVLTYDMVLPPWRPYDVHPWTPMRNVIQQRSKCYTLPSGARVHVKPGCRC